jgi:hypothetical protein
MKVIETNRKDEKITIRYNGVDLTYHNVPAVKQDLLRQLIEKGDKDGIKEILRNYAAHSSIVPEKK